jgi:hypothetical protein
MFKPLLGSISSSIPIWFIICHSSRRFTALSTLLWVYWRACSILSLLKPKPIVKRVCTWAGSTLPLLLPPGLAFSLMSWQFEKDLLACCNRFSMTS